MTGQLSLLRPPRTRTELYLLCQVLWNRTIPSKRVCPDHSTPFDAFAQAYFAEVPTSVWLASRGLGGKSRTLAYLTLTEAVVLGADATLLGGSLFQSQNVQEAMREGWESPLAPVGMIRSDVASQLRLTNDAVVRPLTASMKSVRGPHPQRLRMDECDEMDLPIFEAAMGQALSSKGIQSHTTLSSTHQYPNGTFTEILRRAGERDWPVHRWCIASGSLVSTARGEVPIQEVTDADLVLTRQGWRHVQHVTFMGYKPTITLNLGDRELRCTSDHRIATPDGWATAGALAADTMSPTRPNPCVLRCELMPFATVGGALSVHPRASVVDPVRHRVQVLDVDAGPITAQVIQRDLISERPENTNPDPSVSLHGRVQTTSFELLQAVPIAGATRPLDAVSGEHGNMLVPVWDIGVEDAHEFVVNGVVVHNCWKETSNEYDGWLTNDMVERKRSEISSEMWRVEFDLQEPSVGNRAFDTESVQKMFSAFGGQVYADKSIRVDMERYEFEAPRRDAEYVIAADWAKEQDYTVISVWETTKRPMRLVYYYRARRRPYPVMVKEFNESMRRYYARGIHDATGVGNAINDYLDHRAQKFIMVGRERDDLLSEYVSAVERGHCVAPMVTSAYTAHLYCTVEDLYFHREYYASHLPDEVCSFALAWHLAKKQVLAPAFAVPRTNEPSPLLAEMVGTKDGEYSSHDLPIGLKMPWKPEGEVERREYGSHMLDA